MSFLPGITALMVSMGIEEPEEQDAIWSCMQPLAVAQSPSEAQEQIRAIQNGGDLSQWLPADEEPTDEGDLEVSLEDSRGELLTLIEQAPSGEAIWDVIYDLAVMLLRKNVAYGNSFADPVRIFSRAEQQEQVRIRIDDKLSRIMRGQEFPGDDDINDLIGYLILLKVGA